MDPKFATGVVEYVKLTGELIDGLQQKNAALLKSVGTLKQKLVKEAGIAKQASLAAKAELDPAKVSKVVQKMVEAKFLKQAEQEKAESQIRENPEVLLNFLHKLAERELAPSVKPMGRHVSAGTSSAPAVRESDRAYEESMDTLARKLS